MMECLMPLDPGGCPCYGNPALCLCLPVERVLRAYMAQAPMPALTPEQREACLEEIALVEGYDRHDYEESDDQELARGVLSAWVDYCRDKGLL